MSTPTILGVVGNPRAESRTHFLCRTLVAALAAAVPEGAETGEVDLAALGSRALDPGDMEAQEAVLRVLEADALVLASPTYKATYSGLLKGFLDRLGTGALAGAPAIPVMLGGAPDHRLAIDVHFTPLVLELGATAPVRGLFILERGVEDFARHAQVWVAEHGSVLFAAMNGRAPRAAAQLTGAHRDPRSSGG